MSKHTPYQSKYGSLHRDIDFTTLARALKHGNPIPKWLQLKFDKNPAYYMEARVAISTTE